MSGTRRFPVIRVIFRNWISTCGEMSSRIRSFPLRRFHFLRFEFIFLFLRNYCTKHSRWDKNSTLDCKRPRERGSLRMVMANIFVFRYQTYFSGGILNAGRSSAFSHSSLLAPKRESLDIAVTAGVLRETTKILVSGCVFFIYIGRYGKYFSNFSLSDAGIPPNLEMSTLQMLLPEIDLAEVIGNFKPFLSENQEI